VKPIQPPITITPVVPIDRDPDIIEEYNSADDFEKPKEKTNKTKAKKRKVNREQQVAPVINPRHYKFIKEMDLNNMTPEDERLLLEIRKLQKNKKPK